MYEIWNEPLQTVSGDHLISQVIDLCGGQNVFAGASILAPRISIESVLALAPEAIVASGMSDARPQWLDDWRRYPSLPAVRNGGLFFIHPDLIERPTARVLLGRFEAAVADLDRADELGVELDPRLRSHVQREAAGQDATDPGAGDGEGATDD